MMTNARTYAVAAAFISVALVFVWGCVPQTRPTVSQPIGTIESVQGPDVTVGGSAARPQMNIYEGQEVRTGAGSTTTIRFSGGGVMHLEERTDPIFSIIRGTFCILIQMFTGHAQLDSEGRCIEGDTPESKAFINSKIDILVRGGRTTWRVLEGRIEVASKQSSHIRTPVSAGQSIEVLRGKVESPRQMSQSELQDLARSFQQMRMKPVPVRPVTGAPSIR